MLLLTRGFLHAIPAPMKLDLFDLNLPYKRSNYSNKTIPTLHQVFHWKCVYSMLSLLEKVCSHWSHHMFEPQFVMEEINSCHYCRCVHLCKSIQQTTALLLPKVHCLWEISLFIKLQMKARWKQRTIAILIDHRYVYIHRHIDVTGFLPLVICQLLCHMKHSQAAMASL